MQTAVASPLLETTIEISPRYYQYFQRPSAGQGMTERQIRSGDGSKKPTSAGTM